MSSLIEFTPTPIYTTIAVNTSKIQEAQTDKRCKLDYWTMVKNIDFTKTSYDQSQKFDEVKTYVDFLLASSDSNPIKWWNDHKSTYPMDS